MGRNLLLLLALILGCALANAGVGKGRASAATEHSRKVCTTARPSGTARCNAIIVTDSSNKPLATSTPQGYGPAAFKAAYGARNTSTAHLAVIVAYDAPNIAGDLTTFSKAFGLSPLPNCTSSTQSDCFEKLSQHDTTSYPATNRSWSVEASLDVEAAHGMCPGCRISLIEASSPSISNLSAAVDQAVAIGAQVISNSYGGNETTTETQYDKHFNRPGTTMVVSSGDSGYGTNYPAASRFVVAVGGTTLKMNGAKVASETAWNGAGSGCSRFETKPSWQHDNKCATRAVADIAADADPSTGAAVYDSYGVSGRSGWFTVGGTSLAAPLVAGMLAASGNASNQPSNLYGSSANAIRDIISGNNGSCPTYLCRASAGYDGPTGLGVLSHL